MCCRSPPELSSSTIHPPTIYPPTMSSHQEQIVARFLLQSFHMWKSAKKNTQIDWVSSRCCRCKIPLFSDNFYLCLPCDKLEDEEMRQQKCCICGDLADGGPIPIVCSRSCLRIYNR
jgi:hypothetical protein